MKRLLIVLTGVAITLVVSGVSSMLRKDVDSEQQDYCRFVKEGTYPDYKGVYAQSCSDGEPPEYRRPKLSGKNERIVLTL